MITNTMSSFILVYILSLRFLMVSTQPSSTCSALIDSCDQCLGQSGCYFVEVTGGSNECLNIGDDPTTEAVESRIYQKQTECQVGGEEPVTPSPDNTTTTVTTPSTPITTTSATSITTTSTTPITTTSTTPITTTSTTPFTTTSSITITSTTITTTVVTTTSTVTTTTATSTISTTTTTTPSPNSTTTNTTPTSTESPSTTTSTTTSPPPPDTGRGSHFDSWSFVGGILLTFGLAAIGLVGFKYYKLRSGTGGIYNRF